MGHASAGRPDYVSACWSPADGSFQSTNDSAYFKFSYKRTRVLLQAISLSYCYQFTWEIRCLILIDLHMNGALSKELGRLEPQVRPLGIGVLHNWTIRWKNLIWSSPGRYFSGSPPSQVVPQICIIPTRTGGYFFGLNFDRFVSTSLRGLFEFEWIVPTPIVTSISDLHRLEAIYPPMGIHPSLSARPIGKPTPLNSPLE